MSELIAFSLIVAGGIMQGSFFLGLKYTNPWKWENIWLVYSISGLILFPVGLAIATAPHLLEIMRVAPSSQVFDVFLYGAGWGIGSVLAGLGVDRLGMAIGVSVILAISAALGTFVPLALNAPDVLPTKKGLLIILALVTLLTGVLLVATGGKKREMSKRLTTQDIHHHTLWAGLGLCILSGIFSSMMNFAFAFSWSIVHVATQLGASQFGAINAVWMIALLGGSVPNIVYASYLLACRRTWAAFGLPHTSSFWLTAVAMGLLWTGGLVLYGRGGAALGRLGPVIGYPSFLACMIVVSSVWGFATGEWKNAKVDAKSYMVTGCAVLILACVILGFANRV
jgi:L-rhamnose-H+ transport protein